MTYEDIEVLPLDRPAPRQNGQTKHSSVLTRRDPAQYEKIKLLTHALLSVLGQDPGRPGLRGTPQRVARMYADLLSGYEANVETLLNGALFDVEYHEMVVVKNISFHSLSERHLLPFFGEAHVAYLPGKRIVGLSKIPRIVDMYARRLQIQERLTTQIAGQLEAVLHPQGVAVIVDAFHVHTAIHGAPQEDARLRTSAMHGRFPEDPTLRRDFIEQVKSGRIYQRG